VSSYFFLKKLTIFLVIALCKVMTFLAVVSSQLPPYDVVCPAFFPNSATFFHSGVTPWMVSPPCNATDSDLARDVRRCRDEWLQATLRRSPATHCPPTARQFARPYAHKQDVDECYVYYLNVTSNTLLYRCTTTPTVVYAASDVRQ